MSTATQENARKECVGSYFLHVLDEWIIKEKTHTFPLFRHWKGRSHQPRGQSWSISLSLAALLGWLLPGKIHHMNGEIDMIYPLVNINMTMERSTMFSGKTHYFYGHFQQLREMTRRYICQFVMSLHSFTLIQPSIIRPFSEKNSESKNISSSLIWLVV